MKCERGRFLKSYWQEKAKLEKNMSYCIFGHHKSHMEWPGIEVRSS